MEGFVTLATAVPSLRSSTVWQPPHDTCEYVLPPPSGGTRDDQCRTGQNTPLVPHFCNLSTTFLHPGPQTNQTLFQITMFTTIRHIRILFEIWSCMTSGDRKSATSGAPGASIGTPLCVEKATPWAHLPGPSPAPASAREVRTYRKRWGWFFVSVCASSLY